MTYTSQKESSGFFCESEDLNKKLRKTIAAQTTQDKGEYRVKETAIKENHLYLKAFRQGGRFVGRTVAVYVLKDYAAKRLMLAHPEKKYVNRLGLSVTKKVGGAVQRNRAKRIIRAAYRELVKKKPLRTGYLIVISAKPEIAGKSSRDVYADLSRALHKLDMYPKETK